ncbi:MAG: prenyltransferase [Candidatus Omnitrophota bacterium]
MEQLKVKDISQDKISWVKCWIRALRLPFITASILPFIAGTFLFNARIDFLKFSVGLAAVMATHLGANLINDYADSRSGCDWQDMKFYGFFGGSKLIQEKVLSEKSYLKASIGVFALALLSVFLLIVLLKSASVVGFYMIILFLGVSYSHGPLRFSYRYLGEPVIFTLFGPALVMGGYFIQSHIFPSMSAFVLSVPFGLLTAAILFCNEVPDYQEDLKAKKFTWVKLTGAEYAYVLYYILVFTGMILVLINIQRGVLSLICLGVLVCIPLVVKAGTILKKDYNNKDKLVEASKLTILSQTVTGVLIVLDLII